MRLASMFGGAVRVAVVIAALALACGDDDPTQVGSALRTPPDTLQVLEITTVLQDSVFALPVSLRTSPIGQVGAQGPYTSQILYDFRVPSIVVDEGETLALDSGKFTVDLPDSLPLTGSIRLGMAEVAPGARSWSTSAVYDSTVLTRLPELLPTVVAAEDTISGDKVEDRAGLSIDVFVRELIDYDAAVAGRDTLVVNVALLFRGFVDGGAGFVSFLQVTAANAPLPRFVGSYAAGASTGIESSIAPMRQLVVVEFDSTYSPGTNWVASDAQRFHTFFTFPDLDDLRDRFPAAAFVHRADLLLTQAARGDTIFGIGPNVGVIIPSDAVLTDSSLVFSESENNRGLPFQTEVTPAPGNLVDIDVTLYLQDQQEGTVKNRGMILRLSNESTRARHFEFHGPAAADPALRPRLRIVYGLPADFGEDSP